MKAAIEDLPNGQQDVIRTGWQDLHSTNAVIRKWGWVQITTINAWLTGAGEWSSEVGQELDTLADVARLMVRSPKMEGKQ